MLTINKFKVRLLNNWLYLSCEHDTYVYTYSRISVALTIFYFHMCTINRSRNESYSCQNSYHLSLTGKSKDACTERGVCQDNVTDSYICHSPMEIFLKYYTLMQSIFPINPLICATIEIKALLHVLPYN